MGENTTAATLELLKTAQGLPAFDIAKGYTQSASATSGLTYYDLEAPAKTLYPVLTPLRNRIPRVSGKGGIQAAWRAITGVNINSINAGVSQGNRGGVIATRTQDYVASYRGLGLEDFVNFEADYAADGFDDAKARATEGLLRSLMIGEENVLLGGNTSLALGVTPTPVCTPSASGGSLATNQSVICVALGYDAYWAVAGANNGQTGQALSIATAQIQGQQTRVNADGSSDLINGGTAQKSAAVSVTISGSTASIAATVAPVLGAVAYAWFWGAAGSEKLGAITAINSVAITAAAAGTQTAASLAADYSTNALVFDGLLTQIAKSGAVTVQPTGTAGTGTPLTADGAGGIVEWDAVLANMWNAYRLGPQTIFVNAQELLNANRKIIAGGAAPLYRFNVDPAGKVANVITAGAVIGNYLNKITGELINVVVHPTLPPGTVLFYTDALPYKLSGVVNPLQVRTRQDYYQIEWPRRTRKYEYGIYTDEVLQCYFPPAFALLTNVANG